MKTVILNLFFLLFSSVALCCFTPKPEQVSLPEELVSRVRQIYLAEVIERDPKGFVQFKVIETLKGKKKSSFRLEGALSESESDSGTDFYKHTREDFWTKSGGRMQIEPSCQITPSFSVGKKYLVFVDKPYHLKSFELISSVDSDAWLKKVRDLLKGIK